MFEAIVVDCGVPHKQAPAGLLPLCGLLRKSMRMFSFCRTLFGSAITVSLVELSRIGLAFEVENIVEIFPMIGLYGDYCWPILL